MRTPPPEAERRRMMYTWEELKQFVDHCGRCPLCRTRTHAVMGRGNLKAAVMFVAEAPGRQEDQQGVPFVGPAGHVFDQLLEAASMSREEIYITNIIKCNPPFNRDPSEEEKAACIDYLKYETLLIRPKIMVCLGRVAAQRIIRPDFRITREHGLWTERKGYQLTAVLHPSALLRDPSRIPEAKQDFLAIRPKADELPDRPAPV